MKLIPLTRGLFAKVDDDDYDRLLKRDVKPGVRKWCAAGPRNGPWRAACRSFGKTKPMEMFVLTVPKGLEVDHVNNDTLDNRKENLRVATHAQNCMNRRKRPRVKTVAPSSTYKGVCYKKERTRNPWVARVFFNGRYVFDRGFRTELEAAIAYNEAVRRYHGDFANVNRV